jgi:CRP-like cAMP-binding protein
MGCAHANSTEIMDDHNKPSRYRVHSIHNHKNVNPDQITEEIEVLSPKLTEEQINFAVHKLSDHQLFGTLNKRELKVIAQEMILVKPKDDEGYIFKQGDVGTCFFLIYEGEVEAEIDGKVIRALKKGDTFG